MKKALAVIILAMIAAMLLTACSAKLINVDLDVTFPDGTQEKTTVSKILETIDKGSLNDKDKYKDAQCSFVGTVGYVKEHMANPEKHEGHAIYGTIEIDGSISVEYTKEQEDFVRNLKKGDKVKVSGYMYSFNNNGIQMYCVHHSSNTIEKA